MRRGADSAERGTGTPEIVTTDLTPRAVAALAFIAVQNTQRQFPRARDVGRFLNLKHKGQYVRVVDELRYKRFVEKTHRGLEVRLPC
jgi:hypothetical protein